MPGTYAVTHLSIQSASAVAVANIKKEQQMEWRNPSTQWWVVGDVQMGIILLLQ